MAVGIGLSRSCAMNTHADVGRLTVQTLAKDRSLIGHLILALRRMLSVPKVEGSWVCGARGL